MARLLAASWHVAWAGQELLPGPGGTIQADLVALLAGSADVSYG
jgi:hypothetical protein